MHIIQSISVRPSLPESISGLAELAFNLCWSWLPGTPELFASIDAELWDKTNHNPILLLSEVNQGTLDRLACNSGFLSRYGKVMKFFNAYLSPKTSTWINQNHPDKLSQVVAYFSAEYGIHESLPIYSGGLGILSGDHCKEASDLGLPLVGVGFLYPQGYFHQQLDATGWQEAYYKHLSFDALPVRPVLDQEGKALTIHVELPGRSIQIRAWQIQAGRCTVLLMDTDVEGNTPQDRQLSQRLYGGDEEMRVAWETVFGLGGVRLLRKLGIRPAVWHMNEGHSAFMGLERVRELVRSHGLTFSEAVEVVRASTVFTTHTPVPAGNDTFDFGLIERYFTHFWTQLGIDREEFLQFAQQQLGWENRYSMTVLALKLSGYSNGVSQLHGEVSRSMWAFIWPDTPIDEIPIKGITNGVHAPSWIAPQWQEVFRESLGTDYLEWADSPPTWDSVIDIPPEAIWKAHQSCKKGLIQYAGRNLAQQYFKRGEGPDMVEQAYSTLDPDALIIGFARRFATYKRATLILRDEERLRKLVNMPDRPVQFVFAGKAHPADDMGKHLIQHLFRLAQDPHSGFYHKFVVLEDYDIQMARHLVSGVDVWLNTPRRPHEASGTSGQKAAMCGVPNFSVLDGWWAEGFNGCNGWPIGTEQQYKDDETQDLADATSFYNTLEKDILPLFFERQADGLPHGWIQVMKESIRSCASTFSFRRMLKEYCKDLYFPAMLSGARMSEKGFQRALDLASWKHFMRLEWENLRIESCDISPTEVTVGDAVSVEVLVRMGSILPTDTSVEAVVYREGVDRTTHLLFTHPLSHKNTVGGLEVFAGTIRPEQNGQLGLGVRVRPAHSDLLSLCHAGLVTWSGVS